MEDLEIVVCGFCGTKHNPSVIDVKPNFVVYNYKCPKCGSNDYNKTIYHNDEEGIYQPCISN
jgi:hypothetical protein